MKINNAIVTKNINTSANKNIKRADKIAFGSTAAALSTNVINQGSAFYSWFAPIYDSIIEKGANTVGRISHTRAAQWAVQQVSKFKHPAARVADMASIFLTIFYDLNTWFSKDIKKEDKMPLILNTTAVTAVSSLAAAAVDGVTDPMLDKIGEAYKRHYKFIKSEKEIENFAKNLKKFKSLSIFSLVVRFAVPVLMVPVVGFIVEKIENYKNKNSQEKLPQNHVSQAMPQTNQINIAQKTDDDRHEHDDDKKEKDDD